MDKLGFEILKKNKRMDILITGNKSASSLITKLRLLSGINAKNFRISSEILRDRNWVNSRDYSVFKSEVMQRVYKYHNIVGIDLLPIVLSMSERFNINIHDYDRYPSFIFDLTGKRYETKVLVNIVNLVTKIVHHPLLIIDTERNETKLLCMGIFINLNRDDICKAFDNYNEVHYMSTNYSI